MSHWPEVLHLVGKVEKPVLTGSFVSATLTQTDASQIFNIGYLRFLLLELDWTPTEEGRTNKAGSLTRIDDVLRMRSIYGDHVGPFAPPPEGGSAAARFYSARLTRDGVQRLYAPLRELCRKFDGYAHSGLGIVPPLTLPPSTNGPATSLPRDEAHVRAVMGTVVKGARDESRWTQVSNYYYALPEAWVERSVALYAGQPVALGGGLPEMASEQHLASARRHWQALGYCAPAPENTESRPGDCEFGGPRQAGQREYSSGSWAARANGIEDVDSCARKCASSCPRCHFVSFSRLRDDCSWYEHCTLPLQPSADFVTVRVVHEGPDLPVWTLPTPSASHKITG